MEQKKIDRINQLARKMRGEGLTQEEKEEQALLRKEYVASLKKNLVSQLENITIVDEKGNKRKVTKKGQ